MNKLTILFAPLNGSGHINASIGLAKELENLGHEIVFAMEKSMKGKADGFEERHFDELLMNTDEEKKPNEFWGNFIAENSKYFGQSVEEQMHFALKGMGVFIDLIKNSDDQMGKIVQDVKPHVIIQDHYVCYASLVNSGVPVIPFYSSNPLMVIDDPRTPPGASGFPVADQSKWETYRQKKGAILFDLWNEFNSWVMSKNAPSLETLHFQYDSQYLNLYLYPEDLDYTSVRPLGENWHRIECLDYKNIRQNKQMLAIPDHILNGAGKLIFLSMGSFGSADVRLMKRMINLLKNSGHRFIVSKGPFADQYDLPGNMWGELYLPQLKILSLVDLAIIHGGNNSFLECIYFGKPVIVLPLFADQLDNGQRVKELNLGATFDPIHVTEQELITEINRLTSDHQILERLNKISLKMRNSDSLKNAAKRVEQVGKMFKNRN